MPTVVPETGSGSNSNANSYVSVAEVDTYAGTSLSLTSWSSEASTTNKEKAVIQATRLLNRHTPWKGFAAVFRQPLAWPRVGCVDQNQFDIDSNVVPGLVKEATAEMANALLADPAREEDPETGLSSLTVDKITLNFNQWDRAGVLPRPVLAALEPVADFGGGFTARLVRT